MADNYPEEETRLKASLNREQPSKELVEWAKDNINEDPDKTDQIISDLRDLIYERGECTPHRVDDDYLLRFLRARHFIVRKAHRLMVNYYDFKESTPEYFQNIDVYQMKKLAKTTIMSVPPYRDQHGRRMMILKLGNWDPSEFTIAELFQLAIGILEISLMEPQCQIKGCILIVDLSDLGLNKAWYMTPTFANHLINLAITSFPMRLEAVHFLHSSWVFDVAWSMVKPLIAETVKDHILFHGDDMESLHNYIDPKHLPKSFGGIQMEYPLDIWFEDVIEKDNIVIDELVKLGYEEMNLLRKKEEA